MPSVDTLKAKFQPQIAPGDDSEFLRILTEADLRLGEMARWRWTRGRVSLTPVAGIVTLPADYAAILGARADEWPMEIRDEEYEFLDGGIGQVDVDGCGGTRLIDQGLDSSDLRTYKLVGEDTDDPPTVYTISSYAPYTLYYVDDMPVAPAVTDSSTTRCPAAGALKLMMMGIVFEEANDLGTSSHYVATARKNLDDRGKTRRGGSKQSVDVRPYGPGISGIRSFY